MLCCAVVILQVSSPHPPNFCMLVLSHAVANSGLQEHAVVRLEEGLSSLSMSLSACDRILNTPIPLSYTRWAGTGVPCFQWSVTLDRKTCMCDSGLGPGRYGHLANSLTLSQLPSW